MLKIKVTEKSGASIEYQSETMIDPSKMGHGSPEDYTIEVEDISHEHAMAQCLAARKAAYPSPEEFMNAFFDGGQDSLNALQLKRLEIKAAHPKPVKES